MRRRKKENSFDMFPEKTAAVHQNSDNNTSLRETKDIESISKPFLFNFLETHKSLTI